jgi:hypothetical protein
MEMEIIETKSVYFNGQIRKYDVVASDLGVPCPKFFIGYNSGRPFISEDVPRVWRPFMAYHELHEFENLNPKCEDSCVEALDEELRVVGQGIVPIYVPFRKQVFEHLVDYGIKHDSSIVPKTRKSLEKLRMLEAELTS